MISALLYKQNLYLLYAFNIFCCSDQMSVFKKSKPMQFNYAFTSVLAWAVMGLGNHKSDIHSRCDRGWLYVIKLIMYKQLTNTACVIALNMSLISVSAQLMYMKPLFLKKSNCVLTCLTCFSITKTKEPVWITKHKNFLLSLVFNNFPLSIQLHIHMMTGMVCKHGCSCCFVNWCFSWFYL